MRMRNNLLRRVAVVLLACHLLPALAQAQFTQQGPKLVGTGGSTSAEQGYSVSLSAAGNTAIVGGPFDNVGVPGAAWVYSRSAGMWSQQTKLVGIGNTGQAEQGYSVALSADGNTAILGGPDDNGSIGAAWVFTRSGTAWSQQSKLVANNAIGAAEQGVSVGLSADGNTAIVGGFGDNRFAGAAWVFTRADTTWSQETKLIGAGNAGPAGQGRSVALSADGNTAIVGGFDDNFSAGAAWVFTRSGTAWSQQGNKLVGMGAAGVASQGISVSLSSDGNTAIVGGFDDNFSAGAAWVFTRSGTTWGQQGSKLVGTDAVAGAEQGFSVSLSGDGNIAIVGGPFDNGHAGAAWVFTRSDGVWSQQGSKLVGTGATYHASQGQCVALSGDGKTAIVGGPLDNPPFPGGGVGAAWVYAAPSGVPFSTGLLRR